MAPQYPQQALTLLRTCAGPCRIEHLAQAVPVTEWESHIIESVRREGLDTLESIVGERLTPQAQLHARLPVRHGGLGISDPVDVLATARLAMLLKCGDDILHLGNSSSTLQQAIEQAARVYSAQCGLAKPAVPQPEKHLQHVLTESLQERRKATFLAGLDDCSRERIFFVTAGAAYDGLDQPPQPLD